MGFPDINPADLLLLVTVLLISLSVHESAHAWAADRLGDPTARLLGRVTLNPLAHIDIVGTIIFPILMIVTGSRVLFGWAKPVPVNTLNLDRPRQDHALIAAAGPASNLVLAALCLMGFKFIFLTFSDRAIGESAVLFPLAELFYKGLFLNVILAVFNLFPIPPLDGGWIIAALVPGKVAEMIDSLRPYGFMLLILLLYLGIFSAVIRPVLAFVQVLVS